MTRQVVFIGGDVDLQSLENPLDIGALLTAGEVGFYSQDDGIESAYSAGTLPGIVASVVNTGPGEAEINVQHGAYNLSWFQAWFQTAWLNEGLRPQSANAIIDYTSSTWVQDFQSFVQAARSFGITSIAPIFSPNQGTDSLAPFATNPVYADLRAAAILGGGLTIDSPPSYFFARGHEYQTFIYEEIQWAHQNGLRVTVIVSPNYNDSTFGAQSAAFVKMLQWNNATPSEWVVENYTPSDPNGIGSAADPNSIAGVAAWIAQNASTTNAPATGSAPTPTIIIGAPGTVRESVVGAGVDVTLSLTTTYLAGPIYWGVLTAQGNVETPQFYAVTLDANGAATVTAHLAHSGDYIAVESSLVTPVVTVDSAPVTITEPSCAITPAALGTVQEAQVGAGVTVTETIRTSNIVGSIYWGVLTAQGNVESPQFYSATLDANGTATITAHLAHSGDYIAVETSQTNPALIVDSAPVTITEPTFSITPAALGTVQEATVGAGVTVTETVRTSNVVGSIYWGVLTAQGNVESPQFYSATLDANGTATITAHLAHSGDYIAVETSQTNPALIVDSAPVTITEPTFSITPAALGTVQEATVGAGVTVTETVRTSNVVGSIYWGVLTAQGNVESPQFYSATLDANGTATITAHLAHSGDYIAVETSQTNPALIVDSAPVTITEPTFSITPAALGTVQEPTVGAGVTVTETIRTSNVVGSVYWGVLTAQGNVESPQFYAATLDSNGAATITAHLAHSGDYIAVETSQTNPALIVDSAPVTITEPTFSITPAALGTVQEAKVGAGVTVTETIRTSNVVGSVYWGVLTAQGNVESPQFYSATLDANGTATITAHLAHSGDYIAVETSQTNPALIVDSAPVTIAEPAFSITSAALGTVKEAQVGAGVTVTETIRTSNIVGSIYWGVLTAQGNVESPQFYAATLDANGTATITAHLAHSGDTIAVETSQTNPALIVDSAPVTITEPTFSITPAALGTVQEAKVGAGVTVTETIRTSNIVGSIYWGVLTAQGNVESPQFYSATLDANGIATITTHLAHSGDYIAVETSQTNPALIVDSAPVTITEPSCAITPAALGNVQEAQVGAGVTVTETIRTSNIVGSVYWGVLTAQGNVESPQFYAATLDANGTATITAHLAHSGDYIAVETSQANPALIVDSTPVTITEPTFSITPAALGTVQEATVGSGVTVTETIRTSNVVGPVYWGVVTAQGRVESPQFYAATLDANGTATITAHLSHTGDTIAVETSLQKPALIVNSAPVTITDPAAIKPIVNSVVSNPDFDAAWYVSQYPSVAASGVDPLQDYLTTGWLVGRNPDPWFDTNYYLTANPDVKASGMNPLLHYELYGWHEGRDPSLLFSTNGYLATAPDVAAAGMDPLQHYVLYGHTEGRQTFLAGGAATADPLVDAAYFDAQLGASMVPGGTAGAQQAAYLYDHGGWQAGLKPNALFDTSYYLAHNPDVAAAHIDPLLHYEEYGWKEGRDPSAQFSTTKYLAAYTDVHAAGMDPLLHYVAYGQSEGRAIFAV